MLKLGGVDLDGTPRVAIALADETPRGEVDAALASGADIVELRIDLFSSCERAFVLDEAARYADVPTLATIRTTAEGGRWEGSEEERLALFRALLDHVDAVDVELSSAETAKAVVSAAHANGQLVIGSFHNFERTPSSEALAGIAAKGAELGVDIVKVAAHCENNSDLRRLAQFTLRHAGRGVIVIGMGPAGAVSRVLFPALGSRLTYTFLGEPTAPGQLNCAALVRYLGALYPGFRNE